MTDSDAGFESGVPRVEADEFVQDHAVPLDDAESWVHVGVDDAYHPAGGFWFPTGETWDDSDSGWVESVSELPDGEVLQYPRDDRPPVVLGADELPKWVRDRVVEDGDSDD